MAFGETIDLAILIFATAVVYSAAGQAGASGYLAAMDLVGLAPAVMKPTALALNLMVAAIGTVSFARAGLATRTLRLILAGILVLAGLRMILI